MPVTRSSHREANANCSIGFAKASKRASRNLCAPEVVASICAAPPDGLVSGRHAKPFRNPGCLVERAAGATGNRMRRACLMRGQRGRTRPEGAHVQRVSCHAVGMAPMLRAKVVQVQVRQSRVGDETTAAHAAREHEQSASGFERRSAMLYPGLSSAAAYAPTYAENGRWRDLSPPGTPGYDEMASKGW